MSRRPGPRTVAALACALALACGCAPHALVHVARPGEAPFDKVVRIDVDASGVATSRVTDLPARAYGHVPGRWPVAVASAPPRAAKLHPTLAAWLQDSASSKRVDVIVTYHDPLRLWQFPLPHVDEDRDSPFNVASRARADSMIRSIRAARDTLYRLERARVRLLGGRVLEEFWIIQAIHADMTLDGIRAVSRLPEVVYVAPNASGEPPPSCTVFGASRDDTPRSAREALATDPWFTLFGTGWITLMDTGVDSLHAAFIGTGPASNSPHLWQLGNCIGSGWDCTAAGVTDHAPSGHGTSSAAILVGLPQPNDCERGLTHGSLNSYRVYSTDPADCSVGCTTPCLVRDAVLRAFQLALWNLDRVILAEVQAVSPPGADISAAADQAFNAGAVVIAPQGNFNGCTSCGSTIACLGLCEVKSPANAHYALGIAGWDVKSPALGLPPVLMPAMCGPAGGRVKPELLAPTGSYVAARHMPDTWHPFSATSGAAPYAAGVAVLVRRLLESAPAWTHDPGMAHAVMIALGRDTWTRQATGVAQSDFDPKRGAGPIVMPSFPLQGGFAKVSLTGGNAYGDVPFDFTGTSVTTLDAALWWPETPTGTAGMTTTYAHADVNLELWPPGATAPVAWSRNVPGVFERATAAVSPAQLGVWNVRVQGNGIPVFPGGQTVYVVVFAH